MPSFRKMTRLDTLKQQFRNHYYFSDDNVIDVVMGVLAGNHFDSDPIWLYLISPPSSGKTELLLSTMGCSDTYFLSDFTANSLISGYREQPRVQSTEDGSDQEEVVEEFSTLPLLNGKVLVTKDFTLIFQKPAETRAQIFSILRDIYDGYSSRDFGNSQKKEFHSRFNYLAGMTPDIEKSWSTITLGERFLLYRIDIQDRRAHARRAIRNSLGNKDEGVTMVRLELQAAVKEFVEGVKRTEPTASEETIERIIDLADLLATCRTHVHRESNDDITAPPQPELASRVGKQLMRLCRSLAVVRCKPEVTEDELVVAKRITLDSLPANRRLLLGALWEFHKKGFRDLDAFALRVPHVSKNTVRRELENLAQLGVVDHLKTSVASESKKTRADGTAKELKTVKTFYRLSNKFASYCQNAGGV